MKLLTILSILTLACGSAMGAILYEQSFEDESWTGNRYTDTGDAAVDHDLVNNPDESWVDVPGADATYLTTGGVGLTDGDYVGVTSYTGGGIGSYPDGVQGYQFSDTDGTMLLTFDFQAGATHCSFWIYVLDDGYEVGDNVTISYGTHEFLNIGEPDLEAMAGSWHYFGGSIDGTGQLVISVTTNGSYEGIVLDHVIIADDGTIANEDATWGQVKNLFK